MNCPYMNGSGDVLLVPQALHLFVGLKDVILPVGVFLTVRPCVAAHVKVGGGDLVDRDLHKVDRVLQLALCLSLAFLEPGHALFLSDGGKRV